MPHLIRTPEDIFRAERKDVYTLEFRQQDPLANRETYEEMEAWFKQHLPESSTEMLGPSEHSGWIEGGPTSLRIAFTDADLATFCAQWENADGTSLDSRFQCCIRPYADWWEKRGKFMPTLERPEKPGASVWIETPLGILNHVLTDTDVLYHPANARNLWANACDQWPELKTLDLENLRHGLVGKYDSPESPWVLLWNRPFGEMFKNKDIDAYWRSVADWLRLPPDTEIGSEW